LLESPTGDVASHVTPEEVAEAFALAQATDHLIETGLQQPNLPRRIDRDGDVNLAGADSTEPVTHCGERIGDGPCRAGGKHRSGNQTDPGKKYRRQGQLVRIGPAANGLNRYPAQRDSRPQHPGEEESATDAYSRSLSRAGRAQGEGKHRTQAPLDQEEPEANAHSPPEEDGEHHPQGAPSRIVEDEVPD
jgi:hypothetical protein